MPIVNPELLKRVGSLFPNHAYEKTFDYRIDYKIKASNVNSRTIKETMSLSYYHDSIFRTILLELGLNIFPYVPIVMPWITSNSGDGKMIVEAHLELQFSGSSVTVQQLRNRMYELKTAIAKGYHHVNPDGVEITDIIEIKSNRRLLNVNNHHHFNENKHLFKLTRHLVAGSKIFISYTATATGNGTQINEWKSNDAFQKTRQSI